MTHCSLRPLPLLLLLATAAASTLAQTPSCATLAAKLIKVAPIDPVLCFPEQYCAENGIQASVFWNRSKDPERIKDELTANSNWIAHVTEVPLVSSGQSLVQVARRVGTAGCVRDTYLLNNNGSYSLVVSPSLEGLSQEAGHCGADFVSMVKTSRGPLVAVRSGTDLSVYRLNSSFELQPYCQKTHAFHNLQR